MRSISGVISVLSLLLVEVFVALPPKTSMASIGVTMSDEDLDAVVARGCGEFATTQGSFQCSLTAPCADAPAPPPSWGRVCTTPGAGCGSCTGLTNCWCDGDVTLNGTSCLYSLTVCCSLPNTCKTELGIVFGYYCECSDVPVGTQYGSRTRCDMNYNDSSCLPPGM